MINSRTKGRAGEQDVAKILREELGIEVKRNWAEQAHHGGADLVGVDGWSIEVKRSKKYSKKWWGQSLNQSLTASEHNDEYIAPVLIYRLDRQEWKVEILASEVIMELEHEDDIITMSLTAWIKIVRERMNG